MSTAESSSSSRATTAGANPDEPISLLDDDDDEQHNYCVASANDKKRPAAAAQEDPTCRKQPCPQHDTPSIEPSSYGCMLNPKNPIKIFATDRDKSVRRKLRRALSDKGCCSSSKGKDHKGDDYNNHWSVDHCWTFRELLGLDRFSGLLRHGKADAKSSSVGIDWILITTYILDVNFLLNEIPELSSIPSVVIVYQYKDEDVHDRLESWMQEVSSFGRKNQNLALIERNPREMPESTANPLKDHMAYGCHHTKMVLVGYSSGRLRVNIHTSNLRHEDVHHKCQGAFVQDFLPKSDDQLSNFVTSEFEESLVTYLESYHILFPWKWNPTGDNETLVSHLQSYDFSTAVGVLVPSVPGYHKASTKKEEETYGYLKVQKAIREHCPTCTMGGGGAGPIVCQFSSMGALSEAYLDKIATAWNVSNRYNCSTTATKKGEMTASWLRIVWPTVREIVHSVEGPTGGGSVPGRTKNLHKPFLRPLLHKWKSSAGDDDDDKKNDPLDKGKHVPHTKTYYQIGRPSNDDDTMLWFVLSSHNLSKAAWGEIQNRMDPSNQGCRREVLAVQHWELGVFVSPSTLRVDAMGPTITQQKTNDDESSRATIPLPYKFRPDRYDDSDQPWVVE